VLRGYEERTGRGVEVSQREVSLVTAVAAAFDDADPATTVLNV